MREIRLYIEGGGGKDSKDDLRQAFSRFLEPARETARGQEVRWIITMCGSREQTYRAFERATRVHAGESVFLLVDSDQQVKGTPREHLSSGDTRWNLAFASDSQCHLMVEVMESWFLADPGALAAFYGRDFAAGQIPSRVNVEEIPKQDVYSALDRSTRKTRKGKYDKADHGHLILRSLDPERVRARAPHCDRLFKALAEALA